MKNLTKIYQSLVVSTALFLSNLSAQEIHKDALPTGGTVATGSATIVEETNNLYINQTSDKVILNWETFNVGKDASVEFFQPSSTSTALNRVFANDPSYIYGSLKVLNFRKYKKDH